MLSPRMGCDKAATEKGGRSHNSCPPLLFQIRLFGRIFAHRVHRRFGSGGGAVSGLLDRGGLGGAGGGFGRFERGGRIGDRLFLDRSHRFVGGDFDGLGFGFGRSVVRTAAGGKGEAGGCNCSDTELHGCLLEKTLWRGG